MLNYSEKMNCEWSLKVDEPGRVHQVPFLEPKIRCIPFLELDVLELDDFENLMCPTGDGKRGCSRGHCDRKKEKKFI